MYRKVRHGIYEPVRIRPVLRLLLLALGILLILATIVLLIRWQKAVLALPGSDPTTIICSGSDIPYDMGAYPCGPTAAENALPGKYAHAALATSVAGAGCLIWTYLLGRRSQPRG